MKFSLVILLLALGISPAFCSADASFHLAYMNKKADAIPATFTNDNTFQYMSPVPYIPSSELLDATVVKIEHGYAVKITFSPAAVEKFNALADANTKAQDRKDFDAHTGLGLVIDGHPRNVVQGIFRPLNENSVLWRSYPAATEAEAKALAAAINPKKLR